MQLRSFLSYQVPNLAIGADAGLSVDMKRNLHIESDTGRVVDSRPDAWSRAAIAQPVQRPRLVSIQDRYC